MRLLLIRHAETDTNAALRYGGLDQVPLNTKGRAQAQDLGKRLASYRAAAMYTSSVTRAVETAQVLGQGLSLAPQLMAELREIDMGQWESMTPEELYRRYPDHMREFERDPARPTRSGGESYAQLLQRAGHALQLIESAHRGDELVLAVTHGGVIRAMLFHAIGLGLGSFTSIMLDTASLTELRSTRSGWRLARLNDTAHLEGAS